MLTDITSTRNNMDADKLNEAAEEYNRKLGKCRDVTWNEGEYGFLAGANWLMQQPLADRLTDEEKERIRAIYFRNVYSAADVQSNFTEKCLIDAIFGKELFNEK